MRIRGKRWAACALLLAGISACGGTDDNAAIGDTSDANGTSSSDVTTSTASSEEATSLGPDKVVVCDDVTGVMTITLVDIDTSISTLLSEIPTDRVSLQERINCDLARRQSFNSDFTRLAVVSENDGESLPGYVDETGSFYPSEESGQSPDDFGAVSHHATSAGYQPGTDDLWWTEFTQGRVHVFGPDGEVTLPAVLTDGFALGAGSFITFLADGRAFLGPIDALDITLLDGTEVDLPSSQGGDRTIDMDLPATDQRVLGDVFADKSGEQAAFLAEGPDGTLALWVSPVANAEPKKVYDYGVDGYGPRIMQLGENP